MNSSASVDAVRRKRNVKPIYKGIFSTSICGMFENDTNQSSRTDACALACCGVWLWERNKYLADGTRPKSWKERPLEICIVTLCLVLYVLRNLLPAGSNPSSSHDISNMANPTSPELDNDEDEDLMQSALIFLFAFVTLVVLLIIACCRFQNARRSFRTELALQEFQLNHPQRYLGNTSEAERQAQMNTFFRNHASELGTVHCCCSCGRTDLEYLDMSTNLSSADNRGQGSEVWHFEDENDDNSRDVCRMLWKFLGRVCCQTCCDCWCQCCGICAIAQEHRHLQRRRQNQHGPQQQQELLMLQQRQDGGHHLISNQEYFVDYITFQPFSEYKRLITWVRYTKQVNITAHVRAMSQLSTRLLMSSGIFVVVMAGLAIFPLTQFTMAELIILLGALIQPIVILYFVYWLWNRFDISLDAVIKFFASGFVICTGMTLVYELAMVFISSIVIYVVTFIATILDIELGGITLSNDGDGSSSSSNSFQPNSDSSSETVSTIDFPKSFLMGLSIFSGFINAFIVAALVEELCKYLSFWMIEHPDFITEHSNPDQEVTMIEDDTSLSLVLQVHGEEEPGFAELTATTDSNGRVIIQANNGDNNSGINNNNETPSLSRMSLKTSFVSRGAAITIAMITTALGYASAENLLYVFGYTSPGVKSEIITLVLRAIFPVHPICAALQSIGVCRRDLERDPSVHIGRIISIAWLVHGSYDFILMVVTAYLQLTATYDEVNASSTGGDGSSSTTNDGNNEENYVQGEFSSWQDVANAFPLLAASMGILLISTLYYARVARSQRERLEQLDNGTIAGNVQSNVRTDGNGSPPRRTNTSHVYDAVPIHFSTLA